AGLLLAGAACFRGSLHDGGSGVDGAIRAAAFSGGELARGGGVERSAVNGLERDGVHLRAAAGLRNQFIHVSRRVPNGGARGGSRGIAGGRGGGIVGGDGGGFYVIIGGGGAGVDLVDAVLQPRGQPLGQARGVLDWGGGAVYAGDVVGVEGTAADVVQSGAISHDLSQVVLA